MTECECGRPQAQCVKGDLDRCPTEDDDGFWCEECQNTGSLDCYCGGDLCVCDNYGEYPCPHCAG